jgi:Dolichyl-phosphate-mannose-protein mannosyltransferase
MDASRRASYAMLAAILLLATLIQAVLFARLPTISADGIIFIGIAQDLAQKPIETMRAEDQHPGYPAMLLVSTRLVRWFGNTADPESWMTGGVIVSFICGLLSVAVVWFFTRDLFDAALANIAAIVFTVLPVPRASAVDAQSDTPHVLFYLLAAWMATTGLTSGSLWRLAAAGAASGIAFWIRPEGLEVVLLGLPFLAWHALRVDWSWRRRCAALATLGGTALLVVAPYPMLAGKITSKQIPGAKAQIAQITSELAAARKKKALAVQPAKPSTVSSEKQVAVPPRPAVPQNAPATAAENRTAPKSQPSEALPALAPSVLPDPPPESESPELRYSLKHLLSVLGVAFAAFINSICQGFKFVFIPMYLLGTAALVWHRLPGIQVAFLSVLGATHIAVLMGLDVFSGYIAHRHVIPLVGLAMPFVALGLWQTGSWAAFLLRTKPVYCTAGVVAICCSIVLPYTLRQLNSEFLPVIEATRWIRSRAKPGLGIVCNSPYVAFYGKIPVAELGPLTPTLDAALADAPAGPQYEYAILHVGAHAYQPQWISELERSYRPVLELPVPESASRPGKVVVLETRPDRVRHAAREPR